MGVHVVGTARLLAEQEGWEAVTTRRLSTEIEYSQPVIYKHFSSMEDLVEAVALEGFAELTETLAEARAGAGPHEVVGAVSRAYLNYAAENPAAYSAMFERTTRIQFGHDSPAPLRTAFAEVSAAVATIAGTRDVDTLTEVLWAALHGLTTLDRQRRLQPGLGAERVDLLVSQFSATVDPRP